MFVDTSAMVAMLAGEPEADALADLLEQAVVKFTAPHVRLESSMTLARVLGLEVEAAEQLFEAFRLQAGIEVVPITDRIGRLAVSAFARFGKGRGHPAQLNFGDCLSYACAAAHAVPILFKGGDFGRTDLESAAG